MEKGTQTQKGAENSKNNNNQIGKNKPTVRFTFKTLRCNTF